MDGAIASVASPAANSRLEPASTPRPPSLSMVRPTFGPTVALISSDAEKAPKTDVAPTPRSRCIAGARNAMR